MGRDRRFDIILEIIATVCEEFLMIREIKRISDE